MKIACVYSVETSASPEKPLSAATEIPFGISIIATILKHAGHDVELFVLSPKSPCRDMLKTYIETQGPKLFCLSAVSTQFQFMADVSRMVKEIDPSIFVSLGGHHASLDSDEAITTPTLDAICVGEGDDAVVELARQIENNEPVRGIAHLWIKQPDGSVEKNGPTPFNRDLDNIPYIDREMWEPWIVEPARYPSVLLGRGCPFKCTYCSNHAMAQLSSGKFVRFRSPGNIVGEIDGILDRYPQTDSIYLEVETIGANPKAAFALFEKLEEFNDKRDVKITFGVNFTVTSAFVRNEERCRQFFSLLRRANVLSLNIGLESGSERVRRDILLRPKYSNDELATFAGFAKKYGIALTCYVLIGVPGETLADYRETLRTVRRIQPNMVYLSIFFPYLGTNLCDVALEKGYVTKEDMDPTAERTHSCLNLPGFSKRRIRWEYVMFWFKAYRGHWPLSRIVVRTAVGFLSANPDLMNTIRSLAAKFTVLGRLRDRHNTSGTQFTGEGKHVRSRTRVDFITAPVVEENRPAETSG